MKSQIANGKVIFFLGVFLLSSKVLFAVQPLAPEAGKSAPYFKLENLAGGQTSLSDFRVRPVMLFFWATWCPYCRDKFPDLGKEYAEMKKSGIELLAIDIGEPKERVEKFLSNKNAEFPVLLDSDSRVAYAYSLIGVPTFILIDSRGKIRFQGNNFPGNYKQILK